VVPCLIVVAAAWLVGAEGSICIVMALPLMLPLASIGGIVGASQAGRLSAALPVVARSALGDHAARARAGPPVKRFVTTTTSITIAAPPATVWPLVVSVDSITPREQRTALFLDDRIS
jgi:hypothetical protein